MREIFLLTTDHLEERLWFREEDDFRVAMNYVAIQSARQPDVAVLAFILMSNHVHFVLKAGREDAELFINQFKHRYSIYYRRKYGIKEFLRQNILDIRTLSSKDAGPERAIAYVHMNCVAANICSHPVQYPWGTGDSFFSRLKSGGKCLKDLSVRARKSLLNSNNALFPEEWKINEEGYIHPTQYVDVKGVETLFRTPGRMNYFLMNSSKAKKRMESGMENLPAFRDQTILAALPDLYRSLFHKKSFEELLPAEQAEFVRQIRFRFSADVNQVARVCGISYASAASLLDNI